MHALGVKDMHLKGFILSGGEEHNAPVGRLLLETIGKQGSSVPVLMDRAYADFKTRFTAWDLCFKAAVPPRSNLAYQWGGDSDCMIV